MLWRPKRVLEDTVTEWGLLVWKLPDGTYIMNGDQEYLSVGPCKIGNPVAVSNMKAAVASMGITVGEPFWLPGFRKVTQSEWEDQMERLIDGKTPDIVDVVRQADGEV